jgi:hypothetical protein
MNGPRPLFASLCVASFCWLCSAAAQETPNRSFIISVRDGRVSLRARGADLAEVLEDLSKKAGFTLAFYERPALPLSAEMEGIPVEDCLKKILPSYSLEYRKKAGEAPVLSRVAVFRVRPLARLPAPSSGITVSYGNRPDQLGAVNVQGVERQGPASFAVDGQGNIYVCDTVNGRIKAFSPEGKMIREIAATGAVTDLALDGEGNIHLLDSREGRVSAYDPAGKSLGSFSLPPEILSQTQNLRLAKDRVVLVGRDQEEFDVESLEKGELKKREKIAVSKGLTAESGKSYTALKVSDALAELEIGGGEEKRTVGLPLPRLASIAFLGEDGSGNVYLQVEQSREKGPGVDLGVIKLDPEMNPIAMIEKIPNNYSNWTARLLQVNRAGDVFQMLPGPDGVALNRWNWERKGER